MNKLPPLPDEAFEHGEVETHQLPTDKCPHYFVQERQDIKCRDCKNFWPRLAFKFKALDGKLIEQPQVEQ
jgi:hypothetical protein